MSSRIVHARVRNQTIAHCYLILEEAGFKKHSLSLSGTVIKVLDAFIRGQVQKGILQELTSQEASDIIRLHNQSTDDPLLNTELIFDEAEVEAPPAIDREALRESIRKSVANVRAGGIEPKVPQKLPDLPAEPPPWEDYDSTPLEELILTSPMDYLIEQAKEDKLFEKAVCIVYRLLPVNEWGGGKAAELINQLHKSFISWQEKQNEKSSEKV